MNLAAIGEDSPLFIPNDWDAVPILVGYRGSKAHGTYTSPDHPLGTDDLDWFAVAQHSNDFYLGLDGYNKKEEDYNNIDKDGNDVKAYDVRKFVALLLKGNPNVHSWLWTSTEDRWATTQSGLALLENREAFLSKKIFNALAGYADHQLKKSLKEPTLGAFLGKKRKEMAQKYGYDVKNASHCIRLLIIGETLATDGVIPVKLNEDALNIVLPIKRGEITFSDFVSLFHQYREDFLKAKNNCDFLPEKPDYKRVNEILIDEILS